MDHTTGVSCFGNVSARLFCGILRNPGQTWFKILRKLQEVIAFASQSLLVDQKEKALPSEGARQRLDRKRQTMSG